MFQKDKVHECNLLETKFSNVNSAAPKEIDIHLHLHISNATNIVI